MILNDKYYLLLSRRTEVFFNKEPFPPQLRMAIIGRSGLGKTKLLFKFLLENYFDFDKVVFALPS